MTKGDKVRILPTYCLKKRHGQVFTIVESRQLYGKLYYSLEGEDWLVCSEDIELVIHECQVVPDMIEMS